MAGYALAATLLTGVPGPGDYAAIALGGLLVGAVALLVGLVVPRGTPRRAALTGTVLALTPAAVLVVRLVMSDG